MTREDIEALAAEYDHLGERAAKYSEAHSDSSAAIARDTWRSAARMLREALAKSEAPPQREGAIVRMSAALAAARGIGYGAAWGETPRAIPEAGEGMWRVVGYWTTDSDVLIRVTRAETPHVHDFHNADDYTGNAFCECGEQQ